MTQDFDAAAIERVARHLCKLLDGHSDDCEFKFNTLKRWRDYYLAEAREVVAVLTQNDVGNDKRL